MKEPLGFVGLGIMGSGMAANLLRQGHEVAVWNRNAARSQPLISLGAIAAGSPAEVADIANIVMICVSDTPDVEEVVLGRDGILDGLDADELVIDHSTISPTVTKELAEAISAKGAHWLDAPISGGSEGAEKGTLAIMVGGEPDEFERARPYLEAYGSSITHVGPIGSGQMTKLVNQILVVVNGLAASEALLLAQAGGLDLEQTIRAVEGGGAGSWMLSNRGPQMIDRDWRPGFTIDLQQKDLRLVLEAGDQLGAPLVATSLVFQLYRTLQQRGLGHEGNHALVKALEELAGFNLEEG